MPPTQRETVARFGMILACGSSPLLRISGEGQNQPRTFTSSTDAQELLRARLTPAPVHYPLAQGEATGEDGRLARGRVASLA